MIEVGIFAAKALVIFFSVAAIILLIAVLTARASQKPELEVQPLHKHLKDIASFLKGYTLSKSDLKAERKKEKAEQKEEKKQDKDAQPKKKVFVLNFNGDVKASQVDNLREEITAILQLATPIDEVVVRLESPGGVVHGYGLAASQLMRIRDRQIQLTICVDKVAASGGYMMACVANRILGAPFAIFGSIGVVAQVPNVHRLLKKNDVDYHEYTAGEFKRTVSVLGEITAKGEQKFLEQLEDTHQLFKKWVGGHRPQIDMGLVATGEYWYGERALSLGLVDELTTSDDYLLKAYQAHSPIYEIKYEKKRHLSEKLSDILGQSATKAFDRVVQRLETQQFF